MKGGVGLPVGTSKLTYLVVFCEGEPPDCRGACAIKAGQLPSTTTGGQCHGISRTCLLAKVRSGVCVGGGGGGGGRALLERGGGRGGGGPGEGGRGSRGEPPPPGRNATNTQGIAKLYHNVLS